MIGKDLHSFKIFVCIQIEGREKKNGVLMIKNLGGGGTCLIQINNLMFRLLEIQFKLKHLML